MKKALIVAASKLGIVIVGFVRNNRSDVPTRIYFIMPAQFVIKSFNRFVNRNVAHILYNDSQPIWDL